jgi:hypothetical protein
MPENQQKIPELGRQTPPKIIIFIAIDTSFAKALAHQA